MSNKSSSDNVATQTENDFLADTVEGLGMSQKQISSKYLYDQLGSQLFDQICDLPEYYPTRTELSILKRFGDEISDALGSDVELVEFGSGSGIKTELVLEFGDVRRYCPIDISESHLHESSERIQNRFPDIDVSPICADFTQPFEFPYSSEEHHRRVAFFPGSTIGNFPAEEADELIRQIGNIVEPQGGLLIGVDLQKEVPILEAAYNDKAGVTAQFNLNLLTRLQQELNAELDEEAFEHRAVYNHDHDRIEMHLFAVEETSIQIKDFEARFAKGESIRTEYSHKYNIDSFAERVAELGLRLQDQWTDEDQLFAVLYFEAE